MHGTLECYEILIASLDALHQLLNLLYQVWPRRGESLLWMMARNVGRRVFRKAELAA
jgi:hypothetical protein